MDRRILYLHIGTHKTATTALQQFFLANRIALEQQGIDYPPSPDGQAGHHRLGWAFHKQAGRPAQAPPDLKDPRHEWRRLLSSHMPAVLLSTETLYTCTPEEFAAVTEFTAGFHVRIILYLRRQDALVNSLFNQVVKGGRAKQVDLDSPHYGPNYLNYLFCLNHLSRTFGKENVIVRPFEKQQFYRGSIFADFLKSALNLELTDTFQIPAGPVNPRLHRLIWEYKRLLNHVAIPEREASSMFDPLQEISERFYMQNRHDPPLLSSQQQREILEQYEWINQQVAREYLGRSDGRLFYDALPEVSNACPCSLSEADTCEINGYLFKQHPGVLSTIIDGILDSLLTGRPDEKRAAQSLLPGILDPAVPADGIVPALRRKRSILAGVVQNRGFLNTLRRVLPEPFKRPVRLFAKMADTARHLP